MVIFEKLDMIRMLNKIRLIFYYEDKKYKDELYNFYLLSKTKKINLLKQSLIELINLNFHH